MHKTILLTGATDGIGLATAKMLVAKGHHLLIHGRDPAKLANVADTLQAVKGGRVSTYVADLSKFADVQSMATLIKQNHQRIDVLINNAGVLKLPKATTVDGLDARFMVNTIAPYFLTQQLQALLSKDSRVINLSSAAQAPVNLDALRDDLGLDDMAAYAQSKLAITMWSRHIARDAATNPPIFIALNPGSLLGSKMVKEGFGIAGGDLSKGASIITTLALEHDLTSRSGEYFDNDKGYFSTPHQDVLDSDKCQKLVDVIEQVLARFTVN